MSKREIEDVLDDLQHSVNALDKNHLEFRQRMRRIESMLDKMWDILEKFKF